jgi:two-component system phosphate regulon response regulator PhoB
LLKEPDRVFLRHELIAMAWPPRIFVDPRTVNVHVGRLRRALAAPDDPIRTVRGVGYALAANGVASERKGPP